MDIDLETIVNLYKCDSYAREIFNAIAVPLIQLRNYEEAAIKVGIKALEDRAKPTTCLNQD